MDEEQEFIRSRCVHPTGPFVAFEKEEIEQSISARFEQLADRYTDRLALKTKYDELTYGMLNRSANRLAHSLLGRRYKQNQTVAVLLEQGTQAIAAVLGVLKSGSVYVPLDTSTPKARLAFMMDHSQAGVIVTNDRNLSMARAVMSNESDIVNVDDLASNISDDNPALSISPDDIAYIHYTSGTTGTPKGVVQNHRNVLHSMMSYTNSFHLCENDRLIIFRSPSVFGAVTSGYAVFLYDIKKEGLIGLADLMIHEDITIYHSTASVFYHFTNTLTGEEKFPALRLIRVGDEPVYSHHVEQYKKHFAFSCIFVNQMATSESGTVANYFINKDTRITGGPVPVGYPVEGTQVLLLSDDDKEIGRNGIGEITIKSRYLFLGYWQAPDLTRAAFVSESQGSDARVYRTGDIGVMRSDDLIVHLGRKDFQMKIRGYRVQAEEIEGALLGIDGIQDAVVVIKENTRGTKRLVGYVVPSKDRALVVNKLRLTLAETLPDHMVPSAFVVLEALPRLPNGKVDRLGLPDPDNLRLELAGRFLGPRTPVERELAGMWAQVLGLDHVGIHETFFELGGDSLLAVEMFARCERTFGSKLPLATLFQAPTVAQLASIIRDPAWMPSWSSLVAIQSDGPKPPLFLVHAGGGNVLFYRDLAQHLGPGQPVYGLQAQGLEGQRPGYQRIEDMAAHYLRDIRTLQPGGPYFIGGWSFGCTVAFEMAQQLQGEGQQVALLALLGPVVPPASKSLTYYLQQSLYSAWRDPWVFLRYVLHSGLPYAYQIAQITRRLKFMRARPQSPMPPPSSGPVPGFYEALEIYLLKSYKGRITCLVPGDRACLSPYPWSILAAGGVEWHGVAGDLESMLHEPHVRTLAATLQTCLASAQGML